MKRPTFLRRLPLVRSIRSARGQSLVEFTILLPVLLIMISGLIEFGFMLNYYLDMIDAAREAARWAAGDDPLHIDNTATWIDPNTNFYGRVCTVANNSIDVGSGGQIDLDSATDDIVVSAFSVAGGAVSARFPASLGENGWSCMCPGCGSGNHTSQFTSAQVQALLNPAAPNTGVVLVEMWYDYHMILGLPWIKAFVPDPVTLYAYSMMPNPNVEPTPTP
jgi:Flp pilus assembly protein TadG